jgi:acyl carrier protein
MTAPFTLRDPRPLLVECAGLEPSAVLDDPATPLADLALDSVGLLSMQLELEDRYAIRIEEPPAGLRTAGDVVDLVNALVQQRPRSRGGSGGRCSGARRCCSWPRAAGGRRAPRRARHGSCSSRRRTRRTGTG